VDTPDTVTLTNVGRGDECSEVFVQESTAPFQFRTLRYFGNMLIEQNVDGEHIDFTVDDLTYTYNGGDSEELLTGTSGFNIISKGIGVTATSGLTTSESTSSVIIIDQPISIPTLVAKVDLFIISEFLTVLIKSSINGDSAFSVSPFAHNPSSSGHPTK